MASMKPRIALVCADRGIPLSSPGGGGQHLRALASAFVQNGAEVDLAVARVERDEPSVPVPAVTRLPRGRLPGVLRRRSRPWEIKVDARAASKAAAVRARQWGPTLVYERYALFADAGRRIKRALNIPWVLEVNAPRTWEAALFEGLSVTGAMVDAETSVLRAADRVVVVSEALRRWVVSRGVPEERVLHIPNGSDVQPVVIAPGPMRLGYAGTFKRWHRLPESIPALLSLAARTGPLHLELHGDGPDRETLLDALRRTPIQVVAPGWSTPAELAAARRGWTAAWVPSPRSWPPHPALAQTLEATLGEPCPARWFDPLKGAEARAAGLPIWDGTEAAPALDRTAVLPWTSVAASAIGALQWTGSRALRGSTTTTARPRAAGGAPA
jgi:glycosyltransferase involved in cell wall biosynthesis